MLYEIMKLLPTSQKILLYDIDSDDIVHNGLPSDFHQESVYEPVMIYAVAKIDCIYIELRRKAGGQYESQRINPNNLYKSDNTYLLLH